MKKLLGTINVDGAASNGRMRLYAVQSEATGRWQAVEPSGTDAGVYAVSFPELAKLAEFVWSGSDWQFLPSVRASRALGF